MGESVASHIPDEVWETLICPHLPIASLVSLSLVSCRFRDIARAVTPCDVITRPNVRICDASEIAKLADAVGEVEEITLHWPWAKLHLEIRLSYDPLPPAEHGRVCDLYNRMVPVLHSLVIECDPVLSDVSVFSSLDTLKLSKCPAIENVSPLANVRNLSIEDCHGITDIAALANMSRLDLYGCKYLDDFSMLGNQEYLNLSEANITSVSHLGSVRDLELMVCLRITDISALANVPRLTLYGCTGITDFSMLGNHDYLDLSDTNITSVSNLGSVRDLNLTDCHLFTDISALANVPRLTLYYCSGIRDFSMLGNHEYLDLGKTNITSVSHLGSVRDLTLARCGNVTDVMISELREKGVRVSTDCSLID